MKPQRWFIERSPKPRMMRLYARQRGIVGWVDIPPSLVDDRRFIAGSLLTVREAIRLLRKHGPRPRWSEV